MNRFMKKPVKHDLLSSALSGLTIARRLESNTTGPDYSQLIR